MSRYVERQLRGQTAGIYLRISDDREGRELGVDRQEEDCRKLADRLGLRVVGIYKDNDISASTRSRKRRKDYQRLLADARQGLVQVILAYTTSRLTRKPREHEDLIDLSVDHGIWFEYVRSPSFDLNTADGRRIARMLAANDAGEAEATAERVARAKLQAAQFGKYSGGPRPYGYEKGGLIIRDSEAKVIQDCVARVIAGESQTAIVRSLNDGGVPTTLGGRWSVANFKHTITRKRYVIMDGHTPGCPSDCEVRHGICEHKPDGGSRMEYVAEWPGLITPGDYALMMARFEETGQPWARGLANGRQYLLSGLTRCGGIWQNDQPCGAAMFGQRRQLDSGNYQRRYRCKGVDNFAQEVGCGKVFRDANALDEFVTEAVLARFDSPDIARVLAPEEESASVDGLVKELAGLNLRRKQLAAEHALRPYDDYDIMRAAIMGEIGRVEGELSKLSMNKVKIVLPADQPLRTAWPSGSLAWRRDVIKLVVERIIVRPGHPGTQTWNGHRFNPDLIEIRWKA